MSLRKIRIYGDPVLRKEAEPIAEITDSIRRLVADMGETMYAARGIGLAANQVGELKRVIVIDVAQVEPEGKQTGGRRKTNSAKRDLQCFINPEIVESGAEDSVIKEGCLSLPGLEGEVYRPLKITLRHQDLEGNAKEVPVEGLLARVLQHEIDHLNGVMFVDRMDQEKRRTLAGALSKLRKLAEENPEGIPPQRANP